MTTITLPAAPKTETTLTHAYKCTACKVEHRKADHPLEFKKHLVYREAPLNLTPATVPAWSFGS